MDFLELNFQSENVLNGSDEGPDNFMNLIRSANIEDDLLSGMYYKNDPRSENKGVGEFESQLKVAIEKNNSSLKTLIKGLNYFFTKPDLYNFWRYALLAKHIKYLSDFEIEIKEEIPNCWDALEGFGVNLDSCTIVLNKINQAVESGEITDENYQDALQTIVSCRLALSLSSENSELNIKNLLHLVANNDEIDGVSISSDTSYGWGEHAVYCRRLLEELTDVCVEAPEGVDFEADGYFGDIDWDEVSNNILEKLA